MKDFIKQHQNISISFLIFLVTFGMYISNGSYSISSGDIIPATMMAFNLLENHTVHLDPLRGGYIYNIFSATIQNPPYFFNETASGHLASGYPLGPALISFPLYVIFYAYLKLAHISIDLNSPDFEVHRVFFEKYAASIIAAATASFFYLASRIKFNHKISLITTFTFAFATNQWMISSQALWQHGISNFVLTISLFCLLKANYSEKSKQGFFLFLAGIFCGLFPSIRPSSTAFALAAFVYVIFIYRSRSLYFCLGLMSSFIGFAWNIYYYGNLAGGYAGQFSHYKLNIEQFLGSFLGLTISPSRGLFVYSPIILLSFLGAYRVFKARRGNDEKLLGVFTFASLLIFLNYCFFVWWSGLNCWGARFMTDVLPVLCYLLNYVYFDVFKFSFFSRKNLSFSYILIIILIAYSTFVQYVGARGNAIGEWKGYPTDADTFDYRNWDLKDTMISRHAKTVGWRMSGNNTENENYIKSLRGEIQNIYLVDIGFQDYVHNLLNLKNLRGEINQSQNPDNKPLNLPLEVKSGTRLFFRADLKNLGESIWYGYDTGLKRGSTRVNLRFYDTNNDLIKEDVLYVYGTINKGDMAAAVGVIEFPKEAIIHQIVANLVINEIGDFPHETGDSLYKIKVKS